MIEVFYYLSIFFIKMSVLFMYLRLGKLLQTMALFFAKLTCAFSGKHSQYASQRHELHGRHHHSPVCLYRGRYCRTMHSDREILGSKCTWILH